MASVSSSSLSPINGSNPIIKGEINNIGKKKQLTVIDAENNILFTGEIKEKKGWRDAGVPLRKITIVDPKTNQTKQAYLKVKTIALLGLPNANLKSKKGQDALFEAVNFQQEKLKNELAAKAPARSMNKRVSNDIASQQKTINEKVELFKKVNISVAKSEIVTDADDKKGNISVAKSEIVTEAIVEDKKVENKKEKIRHNIPLDENQMRHLATEIELNKAKWLDEAEDTGFWIKKNVSLPGLDTPVSVEIYPSDRKAQESLGRIDIQMHYIARGAAKKVYRTLSYDTGKVSVGAYAKGTTVKDQIATETKLKKGIESLQQNSNEKVKKRVLISKGYDAQIKVKKDGSVTNHVKFTQKEMTGSMEDILFDMVMPDGTPLSDEMKTKFMLSALRSLEQIHSMNLIHVDIKPGNLLRVPSKTDNPEEQFNLLIVDYDLTLGKDEAIQKVRGTPFYMAPELLLQMKTFKEGDNIVYAETNDIYSLGTSFTGGEIDPWWDLDLQWPDPEVLSRYKDLNETPTNEPVNKNTFEWGVWKMIHFDPEMRFQTAKEAINFFESLKF